MATLASPAIRRSFAERWSQAWEQKLEAINQSPGVVLLAICVLYLALVVPMAVIKLLWADEFVTYYIAKLNGIQSVWNALGSGADPNPPLSHLLAMWSLRVFGDGAFALRIPSMAACLVGVICVFLFLKRRVPVVYAAMGACFFLSTAALNYAYEGRSYALMMGFSMLSMLMWVETIEGERRWAAATMLAIALGAGIASNYFAVLAFFPIAAGELVRDVRRKRIEWSVWIALAVGAIPFFLFLPLINHSISQFAPHAWNKPKLEVVADSFTEMIEVVLIPSLAILAFGVLRLLGEKRDRRPAVLPGHEAVAVFTLMAYPFLGYALAVTRAGMISPRFVLPVCWGFAIATIVMAYQTIPRNAMVSGFLLLLFFSWAIARDAFCAYDYVAQRVAFYRVVDTVPPANTLVVADSLLVQPMFHYAPPQVASRIVFPLDFNLIQKYKHEDSLEQNFWAGRGVFPVPIVSLAQLRENPNYVIVATHGNWILQTLEAGGAPAKMLAIESGDRDIGGFTPLSHGATYFFEVGRALPWDEQYAQSDRDATNGWERTHRSRGAVARGMQQ